MNAPKYNPELRRQKILVVPYELVAGCLFGPIEKNTHQQVFHADLPADFAVKGAYPDPARNAFLFVIESQEFPPVPNAEALPDLAVASEIVVHPRFK